MIKYERTFNQLVTRSSKHVSKKSSKSFVNIWSKLKNGKNRKDKPDTGILLETRDNNVVTIMSARSIPNTSKMIHSPNKITKSTMSKSRTMNEDVNIVVPMDEYGVKHIDDMMRMEDCKLSDTTDNLCQSDTKLVQVPYTAPRKLLKRSKIPRRRTRNYIKPSTARSVQSLRKPIKEQLSVPESSVMNEKNVEEVPCKKSEDKLSLDKIRISSEIESLESHLPEENSKLSSTNPPNCVTDSLEQKTLRSSAIKYVEDSSEKSSDWGELDTSENDSNPSMRRKIFRREPFHRACPSSKLNTDSTGIESVKSLYSEKYNFFDAFFDIVCWPFLFLKAEE